MPNRLHQSASVRILYLGALPLVLLLSACSSNNGGGTPAPLAAPTITVQPLDQTITTPATAMSGNSYTVAVTNSQGSVTSSPAVLTVNTGTLSAPVITQQPTSQTVTVGDPATFTVVATGYPAPTYQWNLLHGGVAGSDPDWKRLVSMPGPVIQVDLYAADGSTIVETVMISQNSVVNLTGPIVTVNASTAASSYPDLTNWYDEIFFNPSLLKGTTSWEANSAYRKYVQTMKGDTYFVFDYATTQTNSGTTPIVVAPGTTVAAYMTAHPNGVYSSADGVYCTLSNMTATTVGTVPTYVANAARPNHTGTKYYTLYELNGNVYCGELIKDGAVLGGNSYHVGTPSSYTINYSVGYYISLNAYALQSLENALSF